MKRTTKSVLHNVRASTGRVASALSFSVYPKHVELIRSRERELNVGKSLLLQILLDVEEREGLLRRELVTRLTHQPPAVSPAGSPRQQPQ